MKRIAAAVIAVAAAVSPILATRSLKVCEGFLPENNLKIPVGDVNALGIDEAEFNAVLDRVEAVYRPIVAAKGGNLVVERKWTDSTVNAYAFQRGRNFHIAMFGGLARHKAVTADGFALVACHELGHHIGGFPKKSWATNEGGSDYYANLKCLRRVFEGAGSSAVDPIASAKCAGLFQDDASRRLCERNAMAGLSIAQLFTDLRPGTPAPRFDTPDTSVVSRTNDNHPAAQCRLDTYYQGSLCTKSIDEDVSNSSPAAGSCTLAQGYADGIRPTCWYKAPEGQAIVDVASKALPLPPASALSARLEAMSRGL